MEPVTRSNQFGVGVREPITRLWENAITGTMQTFARWVATPENRSARLSMGRVADGVCSGRSRRESNPLFLHGPAGTGKTHLVAALAHELAARRPDLTV